MDSDKRSLAGLPAVVYGRNSEKSRRAVGAAVTMSVDSQLDESLDWVERQQCVLVGRPYRDDAVGASEFSTKERSDWPLVMGHITAGEAKLLVVWEISRATRDRPVWAALMAACQERGVLMVVGGSVHDPTDPDDGFMLDLMAMLAVRESRVTSKRVQRLVRARASAGRPHGPVRYGYRVEYDPDSGKPVRRVVDDGAADVVREIAERGLAGVSMWSIAKDLNDRGVPSPQGKLWLGSNLWKLVTSPTYAGKRVFRGQVIGDGTWPAILSEEVHNRLVAMGRDPSRKHNHEGTHVKYLLVGIAEARCGTRVRVSRHRSSRDSPYRLNYACPGDFCVSRRVERVDELVHGLMEARLARRDIGELLAGLDVTAAAAEAAAEVARLRALLDDHYEQAAAEKLSAAGLARMEALLLPKIKKAEQAARPITLPTAVWEVAGPDKAHRWRALDLQAQRAIVKALCRIVIHTGQKGGAAPFDPDLIEVRWRGDDQGSAENADM